MASPGGPELSILRDVQEARQQPSRMFHRNPGSLPTHLPFPNPTKIPYSSGILGYGGNETYSPLHFRWVLCFIPTLCWNQAIGQTCPRTSGNLPPGHSTLLFCGRNVNAKKKKKEKESSGNMSLNNAELVS